MQTETTAEQKELWFLGDDKHWTQYSLAELKKYVFQLKGKIEDLEEEVRMLRVIHRATVNKSIFINEKEVERIIQVNRILVSQVEAYESQKKSVDLTEGEYEKDKQFIADLLKVPITWTTKLSGIKESHAKTIPKTALAYLLDKRGVNKSKIARVMGFSNHSNTHYLLNNLGELTTEQIQAIDNYYNRTK